MTYKLRMILVRLCGLLALVLLSALFNDLRTMQALSGAGATAPPPLPRGGGRWGTPIGYEDAVCCVSGYVFWQGQPVAGARVTIHKGTQQITVQSDQMFTDEHGRAYPYFTTRLDQNAFWVQPGELLTLTAIYGGVAHSIQYVGQLGGQQIDLVLPDPAHTFDCTSAQQTQLPPGECNALVTLYQQLNGPGWLNSSGWLTTNTPCEWHGVFCDSGHVVVLDLDTNQLAGVLPPAIGDLPHLTKLDLPFNRLTGMIPDAIGQLTALYEFYLDRNQLSGPIPHSISNLRALGVFTAPDNDLSGVMPSELGNLTDLWKLDLPFNQLSGPIPATLTNLRNLRELYLQDNQLSGTIPPSLGQLTELWVLGLTGNRLTGEIPAALANLRNLTKLGLDYNLLSGPIPPALGELTQLNGLFLKVNLLTGPIPAELGNLTNLQSLNLSHNLLEGTIPATLGNLVNLQELFLDTNKLSGAIPPEFGNLAQLKLLYLAANRLSGSLPPTLGNLHNLEYLNANDNQLGGALPATMGNLAKLDALYLNANRLSGAIPAEFGQLPTLSYLDLSHNALSATLPPQLGNLSDLVVLDLSYNQLTGVIPPTISGLPNIRELALGFNQLNGAIPDQIGQMSTLQKLELNNNHFSGAIPVTLAQLQGLIYLNLGFNHLSGAIPAELGQLRTLEQLGLHVNQLSGVIPAQLGNLTKLRVLNLHANQLSGAIPAELRNLVNIGVRWLTLGYNRLFAVDPELLNFLASHTTDGWAMTQTLAPTNVQAIPHSPNTLYLTWQPIAYTAHGGYYEISIATTPTGPFTVHGTTSDKTSNSYAISNLAQGQRYYLRIRTYTPTHDRQQNELWSDAVEVSAQPATTLCYLLTLTRTGAGSIPFATLGDNDADGCDVGAFKPGKTISVCAVPNPGWYVQGWSGTTNNRSTAPCNTVVIPNLAHTVTVIYTSTAPQPTPTPTPPPAPNGAHFSVVQMIYVAGDNELDTHLGDFEHGMLRRIFGASAQPNVTTVILYDGQRLGDTARYIIPPLGAGEMIEESWGEVAMDDPNILRYFVLTTMKQFPADYYSLSLVDHANGALGIGYDYGNNPSGNRYLTTSQIRVALEQVVYTLNQKIDILHFDGCSFGLLEDAALAQGVADYVIASPNTGWGIFAYEKYRELAGRTPNDPRIFAQAVAQQYANYLRAQQLPYTISVFDMAYYDDLRMGVNNLGDQLDDYIHNTPGALSQLQSIRERVQTYDSGDILITQNDYYVDLHNLALALQGIGQPGLALAAQRVLELTAPGTLGSFVLYQNSASGDYYDERNQQSQWIDLSGAYGLGIYYPASRVSAGRLLIRYLDHELFPTLTPGWGWTKFLRSKLLELAPITVAGNDRSATEEEQLVAPLLPPATTPPPVPGIITITVATQPTAATNFNFRGGFGIFALDDPPGDDGDGYTKQRSFTMNPGTYLVNQDKNAAYATTLQCTPMTTVLIAPATRSARLTISDRERITCTYTNQRTVIVRAQVYQDMNQNRQWDSNEPWLAGWTVTLYNSQNARLKSAITNTLGKVSFSSVPPGVYTVCEELPANWSNTQPGVIHPRLNHPCTAITLAPGQGGEVRFGNSQSATPLLFDAPTEAVILFEQAFNTITQAPVDPDQEEGVIHLDQDEAWLNAPDLTVAVYLPLILK